MKITKHPNFEERSRLLAEVIDRLRELTQGSNKLVVRQIIHVKKREHCELWTDQGEFLLNHYQSQKSNEF